MWLTQLVPAIPAASLLWAVHDQGALFKGVTLSRWEVSESTSELTLLPHMNLRDFEGIFSALLFAHHWPDSTERTYLEGRKVVSERAFKSWQIPSIPDVAFSRPSPHISSAACLPACLPACIFFVVRTDGLRQLSTKSAFIF